jgi:hypothetical protein
MSTALAAILAACAGAAATLLLVAAVVLLTRRRRRRVDLEAMLAASQREVDTLRHRLDELTGGRPAYLEELFAAPSTPSTPSAPQQAEFVITHVGEGDLDPAGLPEDAVAVPDRLVLSATVGEPLVKVAAFSHGVRRAVGAVAQPDLVRDAARGPRVAQASATTGQGLPARDAGTGTSQRGTGVRRHATRRTG